MKCEKCGRELMPAFARFDGEPTAVGFIECGCDETIEQIRGRAAAIKENMACAEQLAWDAATTMKEVANIIIKRNQICSDALAGK